MERPLHMHEGMTQSDIQQLETYLRDELAAVETYRQCTSIIDDPDLRPMLDEVRESHALRANALKDKIKAEGGDPTASSAPWKPFAALVSSGAAKVGDKPALNVLAMGEKKGRSRYLDDLGDMSAETRFFVEQHLLAEQTKTTTMIEQIEARAS